MAEIEAERALVAANRELIDRMEAKIQSTLARVWGEEEEQAMEDAFELANYPPLSFKTPKEDEYIAFVWDAFETNYQAGKYPFAFLAHHMLTMSFVYFIVWQIRNNEPNDFAKGTIGFGKDVEKNLVSAARFFAWWTKFKATPPKSSNMATRNS